jgi:hypothetical protein
MKRPLSRQGKGCLRPLVLRDMSASKVLVDRLPTTKPLISSCLLHASHAVAFHFLASALRPSLSVVDSPSHPSNDRPSVHPSRSTLEIASPTASVMSVHTYFGPKIASSKYTAATSLPGLSSILYTLFPDLFPNQFPLSCGTSPSLFLLFLLLLSPTVMPRVH